MFRTIPLSIIRSFPLYTPQSYKSYRFDDSLRAVPSWFRSQAVSKLVWLIPLLCVQWKTSDDGQRYCTKHIEFYSKNKFEKLVYLFNSVIKQLDAQNFCFTISLFHAFTCFEQMCSSSGGQNSIKQPLVSSHLQVYDTRGCVMQFWPPDDEHMCSKHVEAWNKLIVKQKVCASNWLITEIIILRSTVSKKSKLVHLVGFIIRNESRT